MSADQKAAFITVHGHRTCDTDATFYALRGSVGILTARLIHQ